jgi:hypothetical protein
LEPSLRVSVLSFEASSDGATADGASVVMNGGHVTAHAPVHVLWSLPRSAVKT